GAVAILRNERAAGLAEGSQVSVEAGAGGRGAGQREGVVQDIARAVQNKSSAGAGRGAAAPPYEHGAPRSAGAAGDREGRGIDPVVDASLELDDELRQDRVRLAGSHIEIAVEAADETEIVQGRFNVAGCRHAAREDIAGRVRRAVEVHGD